VDAVTPEVTDGQRTALPRVAIVGRPNVGKSSLVNRFLGRREAITQELPGVTRDRVAYQADWDGRRFEVVDTGGWEPNVTGLAASVVAQAERAMREADLILLVVDAQVGVVSEDDAIAEKLRTGKVPVLVVANKVDNADAELELGSLWSLGLGEPVGVSALHGRGSGDLLDEVLKRLPEGSRFDEVEQPPAVAIVGRPNVGKSSLLNKLSRNDVAIVDPTPGTTRDTVDSLLEHEGQAWRFVDTAGMRRSFARAQGADYYALVRSYQAVDQADVALLVLEANEGVAEQDQKVIVRALEAGTGVVLLANKWDLMDDETRRQFTVDQERKLHFVSWAPLLRISALTGRGVDKVWAALEEVRANRARRVPTAAINAWLERAVGRTPPPQSRARPVKVRYATQTGVNPPQFVFFTTGPLTAAYRRYLENSLRREFGFEGTPLRLVVRVREKAERDRSGRRRKPEREPES
jgi:GTP-binding protein